MNFFWQKGRGNMKEPIPYNTLQKNERAYAIMRLHEGEDLGFAEIGGRYGISANYVRQIYLGLKCRQAVLYFGRIALALHLSEAERKALQIRVWDCYADVRCVCAYLEGAYGELLADYRAGEPGMPADFVASLPPMREALSEQEIRRIRKIREQTGKTFAEIGEIFGITAAKAKEVYRKEYRKKAAKVYAALEKRMKSEEERQALWMSYSHRYDSGKGLYEQLRAQLEEVRRAEKAEREARKAERARKAQEAQASKAEKTRTEQEAQAEKKA